MPAGHRLVADEPLEVCGLDCGPGPYDLVSALSLWVSLPLYFVMFWLAWQVAVRVTEPKLPPHGPDHS